MNPYIIPGLKQNKVKFQVAMLGYRKPKSVEELMRKCIQFANGSLLEYFGDNSNVTRKHIKHVTKEMAIGQRRQREIVLTRHCFFYLARKIFPQVPLSKLGEMVGGRDHSTVIHGITQIENLLFVDADFARRLNKFSKSIGL